MPPGRDLQRDDVIGNGEHAKAMVLGQHNDGFLIVAPSGGNHSSSQRKIRRTAHSRFQHSSTIQRGRAVVSIGVLIPLGPFAWHGDDDTCFMRLLSLRPRWIFWCDALCSKESSTHNRNLSQARALSGRPKNTGGVTTILQDIENAGTPGDHRFLLRSAQYRKLATSPTNSQRKQKRRRTRGVLM